MCLRRRQNCCCNNVYRPVNWFFCCCCFGENNIDYNVEMVAASRFQTCQTGLRRNSELVRADITMERLEWKSRNKTWFTLHRHIQHNRALHCIASSLSPFHCVFAVKVLSILFDNGFLFAYVKLNYHYYTAFPFILASLVCSHSILSSPQCSTKCAVCVCVEYCIRSYSTNRQIESIHTKFPMKIKQ